MMPTHMRQEIDEIPDAVTRLLDRSSEVIATAGRALRDHDPAFLVTIARGSSDHAASFVKYAIELSTGRPVASLGPSLASIYDAPMRLGDGAAITISQSGKSPDIVAMTKSATDAGALTMALTNTLPSPIADACSHAVDINAGPELAVAATKSYVNSIIAGLALLAEWTDDRELRIALRAFPDHASKAISIEWRDLADQLGDEDSLFMLGRGPALAIASEAALKFKETANMHAEAYSAAEVLHGPVALVNQHFPVIAFTARDRAELPTVQLVDGLAEKGALTFATSDNVEKATALPFIATGHPLTDAVCLILPFYSFVESWSRNRGFNPDAPAALRKVTETK